MDLIITILPVVTKDLPISPRFTPYDFLSRCKFSTLTARQPMVEFYLLAFPRFPLRKKEHKSYFGKNRTHDFRTSRCTGYLLDHSGDYMYSIYTRDWNIVEFSGNAFFPFQKGGGGRGGEGLDFSPDREAFSESVTYGSQGVGGGGGGGESCTRVSYYSLNSSTCLLRSESP